MKITFTQQHCKMLYQDYQILIPHPTLWTYYTFKSSLTCRLIPIKLQQTAMKLILILRSQTTSFSFFFFVLRNVLQSVLGLK